MKKKQKAEPEKHRKSSYQGNNRNNSKSGGLTFSEKKRLMELKHILSGKSKEKEKPTTAQKTITLRRCSVTVSVRSATIIIQRWWNFLI